MLFVIGIVLVLMIFHTAWLEQRIRTLERRWDDFLTNKPNTGFRRKDRANKDKEGDFSCFLNSISLNSSWL